MKKLTLRWRITILTALVLAACSIALTAASIATANRVFVSSGSGETVTLDASGQPAEAPSKGMPDISYAQQAQRQFDVSSILFCVLVTAFGTIAVYMAVGKALRPLRELTHAVETVDERTLSIRLPEATSNDEIWKLTRDFNGMLNRLDDAFLRQKRFTANAAHELKTPLATLKAGMQVLKRDNNVTLRDYEENADMTIKSVNRLTGIVNDLLLIASAEESKQEIQEEIYLDAMFETIFDELSTLYEKHSISYKMEISEKIIYGNLSMLYRAFYNLVENAYKYNCLNGEITVTAYEEDDSIFIQISDTGKGIPEEHLPFVFDAFYRVDASRSRKIAGAGLDLSLVKSIIERHGGHISVNSTYGKGSVFTIKLPN